MKIKITKTLAKIPLIKKLIVKTPRIGVIRLNGVIAPQYGALSRGQIDFESVEPLLEEAFKLPEIKAVALVINSPGGTPVQAALIADKIRALSKEHKTPVYAFLEDVAASGGYWLACAADEIYGQKGSIVGSIGVISAGFGFEQLIKEYGIERRVHTAGKNKDMLDPFKPESPKDVKVLKALQKDLHVQFIDWVKSRRGKKLQGTDNTLFEGDIWVGEQAVDNGLIDGCAEMKAFLKRKYSKKVKFIELYHSKGFLSSLIGLKNTGKSLEVNDIAQSVDRFLLWNRFLQK